MTHKAKSYLMAFLLGLLTVIVCLAVADGMIGVAGTIGECEYNKQGELVSFALHVNDPTGRIIFWCGLLILPVLFACAVHPGHTWIHLPLYILSWYVLSAVFGSHPNHFFLAHPASGFISLFEELDPFFTAGFMWAAQFLVLLTVRVIMKLLRSSPLRHTLPQNRE